LTGYIARQNLAVIAADLGDLVEAERWWREVVREVPQYRPGWHGLGETLIRRGRFEEVEAVTETLLGQAPLRAEGMLIKSRIALRLGCEGDARMELDRAVAECPDDLDVLRCRCQFLFEHGAPEEAEGALRSLITHDPGDASAYHNLGTLFLRAERYEEAAEYYRLALHHRPQYPATQLHLGYALKSQGRISEAESAWKEVLRLSPDDPAALGELRLLESQTASR